MQTIGRCADSNEHRVCKRKRGYDSADKVPAPVAYLCTFCGKWHGASFGFEKLKQFATDDAGTRAKIDRANRYARRKRKHKEGTDDEETTRP